MVIDVLGHCRSCAYGRTLTNFYECYQLGIAADKTVVLNDGSKFVGAVVVAGNGSRSYIDTGAHRCITDISQVVNL